MLDIEMDDELIKENYVDNNEANKNKNKLNKMKQELDKQLKKMIFPKNVSRSYLRAESFQRILSMNSKSQLLFFSRLYLIIILILTSFFIQKLTVMRSLKWRKLRSKKSKEIKAKK